MSEQEENKSLTIPEFLRDKDNLEREQNERICEWLGWQLVWKGPRTGTVRWDDGKDRTWEPTPTFRTGNDAFLMLEKLQDDGAMQLTELSILLGRGELTPDAVRAAVLARIGEQP